MFFEISTEVKNNFPINYKINNVVLNFDLGWEKINFANTTVFFKGYILNRDSLKDNLQSIIRDNSHSLDGNFTAIICYIDHIIITHDINRSYPLWYDNNIITNLKTCKHSLFANKFIKLDYNFNIELLNVNLKEQKYETLLYDDAVKKIYNILANKFELFLLHNKRPLKIFLSGGTDTLTLYSFLKKFTNNFEIVDYEYKKFTKFYKANWHEHIKKFWGYNQMHTWGDKPVSLITGGCGDEYMLRGPRTLYLMAQHYNINVVELLEENKECYHYKYFSREYNLKIFNTPVDQLFEKIKSNKNLVIKYILNELQNDHQHWHIDETIFFTPFKDIEIANIILQLDKNGFISQITDAKINKDLILLNDPNDLKILSKYKNTNRFENM